MKRIMALVMGLMMLSTVATATPSTSPTIQKLNQMPLAFTKNMGQWDERVLFRANAGGATMWFTKEGVTYQFTRHIDTETDTSSGHPRAGGDPGSLKARSLDSRFRGNDIEKDSVEQLVLTAKFLGANPNPEIIAEGQMEYKCNYFLGNDPSKWHTDVPNYEAIKLKDVYPGIDLKYSGDGNGQASYEFIAAPGADIAQIKVEYEGAEETSIDADGRMVVRTKWGDMIAAIKTPTNGELSGTGSLSQLSEKTIGVEADGSTRQALGTLAVELVYSTYLGGGDRDEVQSIAVDGSGNAYVTGFTRSTNFPTSNPYQSTYQGGVWDVFVSKLSSSGNSLIYSTYLGGGDSDAGYGIAVDGSGNAYVTGITPSSNFPTQNAYQATLGGGGDNDAFVTKLSSSGNSLIYSTYLGGSGGDFGIGGIAVDGSGNAYVAGYTNSSNFPTLNPYQSTNQGGIDVFVTRLSSTGNSLIYSTYLGGGGSEIGYGIAVDGNGNAYVTGWTNSSGFPTVNPFQTDQGEEDVFVTKLSSSGNSLIYSTYLGGSDDEKGYGIAVDGSGSAYVTGYTNSSDFPTLNPYQTGGGVFVTKLSSTGNSLVYSTSLNHGSGSDIAVDGSGNAYVTGNADSGFATLNPYQTDQGGADAFVTKLSSTGNSLIYSTYLGGGDWDIGSGIAVDGSGNAYVTGLTSSSDFPTLNPYLATLQGGEVDAFVTKLSGQPVDRPPSVNPVSDITRQEGDTVSFVVIATDPDSTIPNLTALNLPANATFADSGNGHGGFYWPIAPKQYGTFDVLFIASDGILADTEDVAIQVLPRLPTIGAIAVSHDTLSQHVTAHTPLIDWRYLDFNNDDPQLKFEIAAGTDSNWAYSEMWNPAPFNSSDTFVVYNGAPLLDGATYWLRLRVNNSLAWSDWKQLIFRMNSVPSIPQLRLPLAEAIVSSQQPGLIIHNSTDAENDSMLYTFEVSPDNFATTVFTFTKKQDADSLTTLIVDSTLIENGQYWWRVKASD